MTRLECRYSSWSPVNEASSCISSMMRQQNKQAVETETFFNQSGRAVNRHSTIISTIRAVAPRHSVSLCDVWPLSHRFNATYALCKLKMASAVVRRPDDVLSYAKCKLNAISSRDNESERETWCALMQTGMNGA